MGLKAKHSTSLINELTKEVARLKAENWVLKDSQLRTYDGLSEKADKYDRLKIRLEYIMEQLHNLIKE